MCTCITVIFHWLREWNKWKMFCHAPLGTGNGSCNLKQAVVFCFIHYFFFTFHTHPTLPFVLFQNSQCLYAIFLSLQLQQGCVSQSGIATSGMWEHFICTIYNNKFSLYQNFTCDEFLAFWSVFMMSLTAFDQCSGMEWSANETSCNKERFDQNNYFSKIAFYHRN